MPHSPPAPFLARLLAGLAVAVLVGLGAQIALVGTSLARGWPRWREAGAGDLQAALMARVPDAGEAPGAQAPVAADHPTQGPQRDPSCQWLADNLQAAGQRLEKRGIDDPVPAEEREAAVGYQGCSPDDPAIQAAFARYAAAYQAAGLSLPGRIFPGGS